MVIQNHYYRTVMLSIGAMFGFIAIVGGILASNRVLADDNTSVVDEINITVPVSCTISGTGMNTHNANINNGLYENNIGTTTLHAFCNDNEGFAIYAAGYTGNEVGGTNSNKLVGTNASNNATIESGIATTAGNPDISNWAMKLAITQDSGDTTGTNAFTIDSAPNVDLPSQAEQSATSTSFSQYHVVPNEYTKVAHKNSVTDMTDTTGGVKLTTTYAAYISKTQAADTYTGQVIYTLVHPASAAAPRVPISCNPSGTTIGTNSSTDIKCMQDISSTNKSSVLTSMTTGAQHTLIDNRDGKSYFLAKQADGNIWMTQNLDLCIGCDGVQPLTSDNTDLNVAWTGIYNDGYSGTDDGIIWTPASTAITSNSIVLEDSVSGYLALEEAAYSAEGGDYYFYNSGNNNTDIKYTSLADCELDHNDGTCPHYHVGNYYNQSAAFASNDTSEGYFDQNYKIADNSICPKGWKLPGGNGNNNSYDYRQLLYDSGIIGSYSATTFSSGGFNTIRSASLYFTRVSGIWSTSDGYSSAYNSYGEIAYYHTSIYRPRSLMGRYFTFGDDYVDVRYRTDDGDTNFAIPIRCVVIGD